MKTRKKSDISFSTFSYPDESKRLKEDILKAILETDASEVSRV